MLVGIKSEPTARKLTVSDPPVTCWISVAYRICDHPATYSFDGVQIYRSRDKRCRPAGAEKGPPDPDTLVGQHEEDV